MYDMFCQSIRNIFNDFDNNDDVRVQCLKPYTMLPEGNTIMTDEHKQQPLYHKLQDYLAFFEENIHQYPQFQVLLWTFSSRSITPKKNNVASNIEIMEQFTIVDAILKLAYW